MVLNCRMIRKVSNDLAFVTHDPKEQISVFVNERPDDRLTNSVLFDHIEQAFRFLGPRFCGDAKEFLRILRRRTAGLFGDRIPPSSERTGQDEVEVIAFRTHISEKSEQERIKSGLLHAGKKPAQNFDFGEGSGSSEPSFDHQEELDARLRSEGIESFATYLPIHYFFSGDHIEPGWGIYISEDGVRYIAAILRHELRQFGEPENPTVFDQIAFEVLLRHELEHYKIESFSLHAEVHLLHHSRRYSHEPQPLYVPYLNNVYARVFPSEDCLEEGLANRTVLDSQAIQSIVKQIYPECFERRIDWKEIIRRRLFANQPPCYQNHDLDRGWPCDEGRLHDLGMWKRRGAMNFLCNQIMDGQPLVTRYRTPYFAFLPDIYFLRAESLVPIHLIKSRISPFINFRQPPLRDMERLLRRLGWDGPHMTKSRHQKWRYDGLRPVTISWGKDHCLTEVCFKNTLISVGMKPKAFYDYCSFDRLPAEVLDRYALH